jgi:hypothetical protein
MRWGAVTCTEWWGYAECRLKDAAVDGTCVFCFSDTSWLQHTSWRTSMWRDGLNLSAFCCHMVVLCSKIIVLRKRSGPSLNHVSPVTYLFAHSHCPWMEMLVVQFLPRFHYRSFIMVVTVGNDGTGQVFPYYCHSTIAPCWYLIQLPCTLILVVNIAMR